jgi:hypothetical protein
MRAFVPRRSVAFHLVATVGWAAACGSSGHGSSPADGGATAEGGHAALADAHRSGNDGSGGSTKREAGPDGARGKNGHDASKDTSVHADAAHDSGAETPPTVCMPPASAADTSHPTSVVGKGTAESCTESALASAIAGAGTITFDCGSAPVTITVTSQLELSTSKDTVLDGGHKVTLDGGKTSRILHLDNNQSAGVSEPTVTVQNLIFTRGHGTGTAIPASTEAGASTGTMTDGGGGAIWIRDAVLFVFDSTFVDNDCAPLGPDVAGGAIYSIESTGTTIVGSTFTNNSGSNGGAVGFLNATPVTLVNDTFTGNTAVGMGGNSFTTYEMGSGGSGGVVYMDGSLDGSTTFCGDTFSHNTANDVGGVIFRVDEGTPYPMTLARSTFDSNTGTGGAGAFYIQQCALDIVASTFSNNSTSGEGGAGRIEGSGTFTITNTTFASNTAVDLAGALALNGGSGTITNVTFANNRVTGGSGKFAAAIGGGVSPTVSNTIFSNNTTMDQGSPMTCWFSPYSGSDDVQWPKDHVDGDAPDSPCTTGITFADPKLSALGQNGGPTETLLPGDGSAADGVGSSCPSTDQRGAPRPASGCTAGSVQVGGS